MDETVTQAACHFSHVVPTEGNDSLFDHLYNGALNGINITQKFKTLLKKQKQNTSTDK